MQEIHDLYTRYASDIYRFSLYLSGDPEEAEEIAVGIIGSEDHPANVLYFGVLLVGLLGTALSGLRARGMARAMYAVAAAQLLVPVIALLGWPPVLDNPPGLVGIFLLNSFFAILFAVAGILFRRAARA